MQLQGALTMSTTPALLKHAGEWVASGTVDLSAVTTADSSGVAFLLELKRRALVARQPLRFSDCPVQLRGLVTFFQLEEALLPEGPL